MDSYIRVNGKTEIFLLYAHTPLKKCNLFIYSHIINQAKGTRGDVVMYQVNEIKKVLKFHNIVIALIHTEKTLRHYQ